MKPKSEVNLHIERLVVDASLLETGPTANLQRSVETELTQLLRHRGLQRVGAGAVPSLRASFAVAKPPAQNGIGQQIALAVYSTLSPESGEQR